MTTRSSLPRGPLSLVLLVVLGGTGPPALGAQIPGEVRGVVVDAARGVPIGGVEVQLHLRAGGELRERSGPAGDFRFAEVPAGEHRLRIRHPGYHPLDRDVEVAEGRIHDLRLELTSQTLDLDTLRVLASSLSIRRTDTEFTARIDRRAMEALPTAYDPQDLVLLAPGAAPGRIWGGAADEANVYQLDGMRHTHPGTGGPVVAISPSWLEAVEVRGLGAGAEHGGFQGGIVNAVTRTGTNRLTRRARASAELGSLNASNLVPTDVGRERARRTELEMDAAGPVVADRLFYFGGVHLLDENHRVQSRIRQHPERFLPHREERLQLRGFGKLTWTPVGGDRMDLSGGFVSDRARNWGLSGYESESAAGRRTAPAWFYQGAWRRGSEADGFFEVRASGAGSRERVEPGRGMGVPAVRSYASADVPTPVFRNAPFRIEQRPQVHSVVAALDRRIETGPWTHRIRAGVEATRTSWMDRRTRTAGMTWRTFGGNEFDPEVPASWFHGSRVASDWGGEVDLHARMGSEALFLQNHLVLHPRLTLSPGLRFARWRGDLLPGGDRDRRFRAVRTRGVEPRIGLTVDPLGTNEWVLKAHWGRVHQDLLAPFFDRAEGGEVFSNRELWSYRGDPFADPATTFTPEERDARAATDPPGFTLDEVIRLNEVGRVSPDLVPPHVDQWLVGMERTFGPRIRAEALWIDRTNRNLVALQDLNAADNYHRYEAVRVLTMDGQSMGFGDGPMTLPAVYVPNDWIRQLLVWLAETPNGSVFMPPGFVFADTLDLSFEQDLELRNVPDARRHLRQLQLSVHGAFAGWGGSVSVVHSRLRGNLNSVSGYEAGTTFEEFREVGAGPFVRPNETVNFDGRLPGLSALELKVAAFGELPRGFRAGAFLHAARGERFTPWFTLTTQFFTYAVEQEDGELLPLDRRLIHGVAGQRVFMQERGAAHYEDRFTLDLRVERTLPVHRGRWRVTADVFNVWNSGAVTRINPSVNFPEAEGLHPLFVQDPPALFGAVWERIPPRTLRIGVTTEF